jgi:4-hydroxyphenylacetate 3-monooxygenase
MLRTGNQYRQSMRDGRQVWISGEQVAALTRHLDLQPIVDIRAWIDDMAQEQGSKEIMSGRDAATGAEHIVGYKLPHGQDDGHAKPCAVDTVMRQWPRYEPHPLLSLPGQAHGNPR